MASYNKVILMGNLTRDPEMKYLPSGTAVANFGIAMNERYTDKQTGEQKEIACFVDVEAWDRQAEIVNEYFSKGSPIFLEGALKFDSWETPEGEKRSKLRVRLIKFQFVGGRQDGDEAGGGYTQATPPDTTPMQEQPDQMSGSSTGGSDTSTDDDIPF
ncbi:MAG: single-stranded DNA-binding protein [Candidatus Poribacteria bacterium]|nr:single-stranded DNA-binding protein [Candidatus Poribacteria bacterium]